MEGISITKLLVIAVLIVLLFGTNKLRTLGSDLGAALKGFKKAMNDDSAKSGADADSAALRVDHKD
ncbi:twin-arginine translocase subunit TatE [Hafnia paralvei]|uniref:twin-arginine translocase subunit TatE n=1 Tax=Hafnia paralvei TaxID=546367 RepID=UPI00241E4D0E|nr:twin-arginine translocase subunit TatE [Hafnia paralvei]